MRRRNLLGLAATGGLVPAAWSSAPAAQIVGADAGHGTPALGGQQGELLLCRQAAGGLVLQRQDWGESRGDVPAAPRFGAITLGPVAADAGDLRVPVRDGPYGADPARWLLWREGAVLHAMNTSKQRVALTLAAAPAAVLRPALQRTGGTIDLWLLSADRRKILRVQFPRDANGKPSLADEIPLPAPASDGCTGFGDGGRSVFGLFAQRGSGILLMVHDGAALQQLQLPGLQARSAPTLVVNEGSLWLALLVVESTGLSLLEARFKTDGSAPAHTLRQLEPPAVAIAVRSAALVYRSWNEGERKLHGLVELADSSLRRLNDQLALAPFQPASQPLQPLVLQPGARGAYVLCIDAQHNPVMVAL